MIIFVADADAQKHLEALKGHLTNLINRKPPACCYFEADKDVWCVCVCDQVLYNTDNQQPNKHRRKNNLLIGGGNQLVIGVDCQNITVFKAAKRFITCVCVTRYMQHEIRADAWWEVLKGGGSETRSLIHKIAGAGAGGTDTGKIPVLLHTWPAFVTFLRHWRTPSWDLESEMFTMEHRVTLVGLLTNTRWILSVSDKMQNTKIPLLNVWKKL